MGLQLHVCPYWWHNWIIKNNWPNKKGYKTKLEAFYYFDQKFLWKIEKKLFADFDQLFLHVYIIRDLIITKCLLKFQYMD